MSNRKLVKLQTSIREQSPESTLRYVERFRDTFGISRVTDSTLLDKIGLPVFSAIRPNAEEGSLCVSSGKSTSKIEAKLGAICEAIELSCVQFDSDRDAISRSRIESFESQFELDIYDFCVSSRLLKKVPYDLELETISVTDLYTDKSFELPATLIFFPYRETSGSRLFGQSSNGLSGGNSIVEALYHSTLEVIERDTLSFSRAVNLERRVTNIESENWQSISERISEAGLEIIVTFSKNEFGIPMFIAYLFDHEYWNGVCVSRGQGLHWDKDIALTRAITESIQSRLTNIHGGRDDIVRRFSKYEKLGIKRELSDYKKLENRVKGIDEIEFESIYTNDLSSSVYENFERLISRLQEHGFKHLFYYDLTKNMDKYFVVKVVIPGMEFFSPESPRVGKRLLASCI